MRRLLASTGGTTDITIEAVTFGRGRLAAEVEGGPLLLQGIGGPTRHTDTEGEESQSR